MAESKTISSHNLRFETGSARSAYRLTGNEDVHPKRPRFLAHAGGRKARSCPAPLLSCTGASWAVVRPRWALLSWPPLSRLMIRSLQAH